MTFEEFAIEHHGVAGDTIAELDACARNPEIVAIIAKWCRDASEAHRIVAVSHSNPNEVFVNMGKWQALQMMGDALAVKLDDYVRLQQLYIAAMHAMEEQ